MVFRRPDAPIIVALRRSDLAAPPPCPPSSHSISEGTIMMLRPRFASWLSLASLAVMALGVGIATESQTLAAAKKLNSIEGITEYQLDNGLQVLLYPDPSRPTVTVNLTVLVGSRHEGYG